MKQPTPLAVLLPEIDPQRGKSAGRLTTLDYLPASRTTIYQLVKAGDLVMVKIAGRSAITVASIEGYMKRLERQAAERFAQRQGGEHDRPAA